MDKSEANPSLTPQNRKKMFISNSFGKRKARDLTSSPQFALRIKKPTSALPIPDSTMPGSSFDHSPTRARAAPDFTPHDSSTPKHRQNVPTRKGAGRIALEAFHLLILVQAFRNFPVFFDRTRKFLFIATVFCTNATLVHICLYRWKADLKS